MAIVIGCSVVMAGLFGATYADDWLGFVAMLLLICSGLGFVAVMATVGQP